VPCARLHTRQVLWEWGLSELAATVELVVSEIVTNAVRASIALARMPREEAAADRIPTVRFWLAADKQQRVLVQVWDGSPWQPQRQQQRLEAESGRGLLLVAALCQEWGAFVPEGWWGKVVWGMIRHVVE
jgi:hypothetical protein